MKVLSVVLLLAGKLFRLRYKYSLKKFAVRSEWDMNIMAQELGIVSNGV